MAAAVEFKRIGTHEIRVEGDLLYLIQHGDFTLSDAQGVNGEVEALLARKLNPNLPIMRGIGVREIGAFLLGDTSVEQTIAAGQQATRRYAKRQYTWFAHQPPAEWPRFREALDVTTMAGALELL